MGHVGLSLAPNEFGIHDLHLAPNGNLAVVRDAEAVGQHVRQRLKTFFGEWFMDTDAGVEWLTEILGSDYDPAKAEAVIKAEILATHGVREITGFSVRFNRTTRELAAYDVTVLTDYDEIIEVSA